MNLLLMFIGYFINLINNQKVWDFWLILTKLLLQIISNLKLVVPHLIFYTLFDLKFFGFAWNIFHCDYSLFQIFRTFPISVLYFWFLIKLYVFSVLWAILIGNPWSFFQNLYDIFSFSQLSKLNGKHKNVYHPECLN